MAVSVQFQSRSAGFSNHNLHREVENLSNRICRTRIQYTEITSVHGTKASLLFTFGIGKMLKLRQNFLPKLISEFISLGFVFFILPAIYIFEISVAIPAYYAQDIDSWWPCIHSILGTYVMFNLLGNLIGVIFVDTGFKGAIVDPAKVGNNYFFLKMEFFPGQEVFWYSVCSRWQRKDGTFVRYVKRTLLPEHGTATCVTHAFWKGNITVGSQAAASDFTISDSFIISFFICLFPVFMQHFLIMSSYGHW